jgi:hypothetical protein
MHISVGIQIVVFTIGSHDPDGARVTLPLGRSESRRKADHVIASHHIVRPPRCSIHVKNSNGFTNAVWNLSQLSQIQSLNIRKDIKLARNHLNSWVVDDDLHRLFLASSQARKLRLAEQLVLLPSGTLAFDRAIESELAARTCLSANFFQALEAF